VRSKDPGVGIALVHYGCERNVARGTDDGRAGELVRPGDPRRLRPRQVGKPMISSFDLHLRAEKKSPKMIRTYLEAMQWMAAEYPIPSA
jgi:hypothetical protein